MKINLFFILLSSLFMTSCAQSVRPQDNIPMPYWTKDIRMRNSSSLNIEKEFQRGDSIISNRVIMEIYTGNHPLQEYPITSSPGLVEPYHYKPYSYLVIEFDWKKCEEGWRFSDCRLVEQQGKMLYLTSVDMNNGKMCQSGVAEINTYFTISQILEPERYTNFVNPIHVILDDEIIYNENKGAEFVVTSSFFHSFHFNSDAIRDRAFFYDIENGLGETFRDAAGFHRLGDYFLRSGNTVATGRFVDELTSIFGEDLKIGVWDHFVYSE
jgi:hypothetical protein